jgi:hypothetical protein
VSACRQVHIEPNQKDPDRSELNGEIDRLKPGKSAPGSKAATNHPDSLS